MEMQYYPVEEFARLAHIEVLQAWHYIETDQLMPSFKLARVECRFMSCGEDGRYGYGVSDIHVKEYAGVFMLWFPFSHDFWVKHFPITKGWEIDLIGQKLIDRDKNIFTPLKTAKVTIDDIVISQEELDRFKAEHPSTPIRTIKRSMQDIQSDIAKRESGKIFESIKLLPDGIDYLTLEEFCGRFNLTEAKAKWEIKRSGLQDCGYMYYLQYYDTKTGQHRIVPDESRPYLIPESEADRYDANIKAESQPTPATPEPAATADKKAMPEGMKKSGEVGTFKTFVNEALRLKICDSGTSFIRHIRDCFNDKSKYPFLKEVIDIKLVSGEKDKCVCFTCEISKRYPEGLHWYTRKQVTDMWSQLKKTLPEK